MINPKYGIRPIKHLIFILYFIGWGAVAANATVKVTAVAPPFHLFETVGLMQDTITKPQPKDVVYILHSDYSKYDKKLNADARILVGNVVLRHDSLYMYCDSANYYDGSNSFEAFDNVRMEQGDTLFLYGDYMEYNGTTRLAKIRNHVKLINNNSVLETDSLDYDRNWNLGYYFEGGTLYDEENTLTSDWGQYNTATKDAVFNFNVELVNKQFVLNSDTLEYNTNTKIANITGPSDIVNKENHIYSELGYYDTGKGQFTLLNRSVVNNQGKEFVADSIFYDKNEGYVKAFEDIVFTDTINKNGLTGGYVYYNELIDSAFATIDAIASDFSQGDTLYIHGDTIVLQTVKMIPDTLTLNIPLVLATDTLQQAQLNLPDSLSIDTLSREVQLSDSISFPIAKADAAPVQNGDSAAPADSVYRLLRAFHKVRMYRKDIQAVCDSMVFDSRDSCLVMYYDPILWNNGQQLLGEVIKIYMDSSSIDWMHILNQALFVQRNDSVHYNQIAGNEMKYYFTDGDIRQVDVIGNVMVVYYPEDEDSLMIGMNTTEASLLKAYMKDKEIEKIVIPSSATGTMYPMTQLPADKMRLKNFVWFDYIRPRNKMDVLIWRGKKSEDKLKKTVRKEVPLPKLNKTSPALSTEKQ